MVGVSDNSSVTVASSHSPVETPVSVEEIKAAAKRITGAVRATPLEYSPRLSEQLGAEVYLKREDLQQVRSYKIRGAYNLIDSLDDDARAAGVVTASAGNHAQGVAWSCQKLGIEGRIYVPTNTPKQKRDRIRFHGGEFVELVVTGANFDEAQEAALADVKETNATFVPPFDHAATVAGQGTIGVEIEQQLGTAPDVVVIPVGGGGLLAGIASYLAGTSQVTRFVAAEPAGAASLTAAAEERHPVTLSTVDTFVDGASVKRIGDVPYRTFEALRDRISVRTVDEGAISTAMLELYQNEGIIAEPAGAMSIAALEEIKCEPGQKVVCIVSGGNNDVSRYSEIIERSLVHRGLKHYFLVNFPQEPGQLRKFLDEVLGPDDDVTLFEYLKRNNREIGAALVGIELGDASDLGALLHRMDASPIHCERLEPGTTAYAYLT